ncbi:hypothetical protein DPMN_119967 [Dreissena polymorpha]|uniref:J domain-containing protein n=1 Tax=Dreissena polymorpha TaxID=45954 RepID=A0A9D4JPU2_DREPO|nr:hypothetical protein DPMN_119967 [Dreissena polymorpha]
MAELFHDQDQRFPTENFLEPLVHKRLDQLGMMKDNLPEDLVLERANSVMVLNQACHLCALRRCSAFLEYLESHEDMLSIQDMFSKLKKIQFIPVMTKPENWQFAWKGDEITFQNKCCPKHLSNEHQAAFVAPSDIYLAKDMPLLCCSSLIMCDKQIGRKFVDGFFERLGVRTASDNEQSVVCVIQQLVSLDNCTKEEHVRPLYDFLNQACHDSLLKNIVKSKLQNQKVVFVDHCFVFTLHVAQSSVVHCPPFLFSLQNTTLGEEKYSTLCKALDFKPAFEIDDLLSVLDELKHDKQECSLDDNCLNQVIHLLKCLNDLMEEAQKKEKHINCVIYVPDTFKVLRPSKELCFNEFDTLGEDDDNVNFIHSEVPMKHAKRFGVRSIRQQMLSDAYAFEEWGQDEPLTRRLKVLLEEGYVDGFAVGKELFQNADDAKASKMYMLYDERQNEMLRSNLISETLAECQGPALWVYNDARFSEDDLIAITKLNGGTKQFDTTKIGKFGLGFCSVYNLTDVPSFISGENFVMFDPHTTFLGKALPGKSPGIRLNFSKDKNLKVIGRMKHQFDVFEGVFDCQITQKSQFFNGTLFRLPLRTRGYQISDKVYTKEEMVDLLHKIVEMAPNMFLFNQYISELKIFHLNDKENISNMHLIHHVVKHEAKFRLTDLQLPDLQLPIMIEASNRKKTGLLQQNPIQCVQKVTISTNVFVTANMSMEGKTQSSVSNWLISWASGKDSKTIMISEKEKGALPLGAVAALIAENYADADCGESRLWPLVDMKIAQKCFFQKGHYFFYLPLPIECSFPFHINAQFSVTSDRRHFRCISEDDKDSSFGKWNDAIMSDMIVDALLQLLSCNSSNDPYFLWPLKSIGSIEPKLVESFYKTIVNYENKYCIFRVADKLTPLSNVQFLHSDVRKNETFGEAIFEMLGYLMDGKMLVDLPVDIYERLLEVNEEVIMSKTVTAKDFVLKYFLPNINYIKPEHENLRNKVMAYTLTLPPDNNIEELISCTACIPTDPDNVMRAPKDLVDPNSDLCKMFLKNDGYFPSAPFTEYVYIIRLQKLGMMFNIISDDVLIERANTVASLYKSCCFCALQRSICVMNYIQSRINDIENNSALKETLQNCRFCVVQNKPQGWEYDWHGGSIGYDQILCKEHTDNLKPVVLACPVQMFSKESKNLVGCHSLIVDNSYSIFTKTIEYLGINQLQGKNETHVEHVLKQLKMIVCLSENKVTLKMQRVIKDIYDFIEKACYHGDAIQKLVVEYFLSEDTILTGNVFVNPVTIVKSCYGIDCKPYIYTLGETFLSANTSLCNVLQIKATCTIDQLIRILKSIYEVKEESNLNEEEFRHCKNLVNCIAHIINKQGLFFDEILKDVGTIYVPDTDMILQPSHKLCFDDYDFIPKSDSMIYVNWDISKNTAKAIGVRKKKMKHYEENSIDIEGMEDFYQQEPLITRIQRLLIGYPPGVELLKEILQNADDAGGTEVCFVLDYEFHSEANLLSKTMRPLQGPALCVYNNSAFTEADLIGIKQLGIGSKGDDPLQIGRYGVGFNVVYNITDTPTFLTIGEDLKTLCYFDPIAETIPGVNQNKPGKRLTNLDKFRKHHPALFSGFHESHFFKSGKGTMFRLPLRTKPSSISSNVVTVDIVQALLNEFRQYMTRILLFLKNIAKLSIVEYKHGDYKCLASVQKTCDNDSAATMLDFSVKSADLCKMYKESKELITQCQQHVSSFRVTVLHEENGTPVPKQNYTIVQALGFRQTLPALLKEDILRGSIALLPVGGVAYKEELDNTINDQSNVYCFLPLPLKSGLPVYVHGYFALDHETRRSLWNASDELKCTKTLWNKCLIEDVISAAYVRLIGILKERFTSTCERKDISEFTVTHRVEQILNVYPLKSKVNGTYWEWLVKGVYSKLESEKQDYLPSYRKEVTHSFSWPQKSAFLRLTWLCVQPKDHTCPTLFKDGACDKADDYHLDNILMDIGLKIVSLKPCIRESIEFAGVQCIDLKPRKVIDFLMSFCNKNVTDYCRIETDIDVAKSVLCSMDNVRRLINYIAKDKPYFEQNVSQIPVVVSEDNIIRCLNNSGCMFVTEYSTLFPNKKHLFLHNALLNNFKSLCDKHEHLKLFTLKEFSKLAHCAEFVPKAPGRVKIEPEIGEWLKVFWIFFHDCFNTNDEEERGHDIDINAASALSEALCEIEEFLIVPICEPMSKEKFLCSSKEIPKLLNVDSFQLNWRTAFTRLNIPQLDIILKAQSRFYNRGQDAFELLNTVVPNVNAPNAVLKSLEHNTQLINNADVSNDDVKAILGYFNQCLTGTQIPDIYCLRHLRLFISSGNERVAISEFERAYIIPGGMPFQGLQTIILKSNMLLITADKAINLLMKTLGLKEESLTDVYIQHIIPKQKQMSREDFYHHVFFLAGYMCHKDIVVHLSNADFIETASKCFVTVRQLFDHENKIFREMCSMEEFLPKELQAYHVGLRDLMLKLGLQDKLNIHLYERFARKIEEMANRALDKTVKEKAISLLERLAQEDVTFFEQNNCDTLSNIKFVTPKIVGQRLQKLHPQYQSKGLVSLSECVTDTKSYICWTTCSIFPHIKMHPIAFDLLKIQSKPSPSKWIEHCKQIGLGLQKILSYNPSNVDVETIQQVLEAIYKSVHEYGTCAKSLQDIPMVLFLESGLLVPAKNILIECSQFDEIKPLLMKAPVCFGSYFSSFIALGARKKPDYQDYANILDNLPHEEQLSPLELHNASLAVTLFFKHMNKSDEIKLQNLHLLCTNDTIRRANYLVVNDRPQYRRRLMELDNHLLFAAVDLSDIDDQLLKLPKHIRPYLLSELVIEDIDLSRMQIIPNSHKASAIKEYLQSGMFKNSIVRIARKSCQVKGKTWDSNNEVILSKLMDCIKVNEVTNMFTVLKVFYLENGQKSKTASFIDGTRQNRSVHVHEEENSVISINFCTKKSLWFDTFRREVALILKKHVGGKRHLVQEILNYKLDSDDLLTILTENNIPLYNSKLCRPVDKSEVPVPGDFVQKKFHKFLSRGYGVIPEHDYEFIALLVEDPALQENEDEIDTSSTYIYVHVKKRNPETVHELPIFQEYEIDSGEENRQMVKAFLLYRFIREEGMNVSNGKSLVVYDRMANESPAIESEPSLIDVCKEVRQILQESLKLTESERRHVIKRLMFKWHPDKNPNRVQMATKVFQYIRQCLDLMNQGKSLTEFRDENEDFTDAPENGYRGSDSHNWYDRYWKKQRKNYSDDDWFFTTRSSGASTGRSSYSSSSSGFSSFSTGFSYRHEEAPPYPFPAEAKRWQRQAQADLEEAQRTFDYNGYPNWICYKAHQVSNTSWSNNCVVFFKK